MGEALKHIKAKGVELPVDQVGSAICWLAGADKAAGRATFVECFGSRLDAAIARGHGEMKAIEHRANEGVEQHDPSELER